MVNGENNLTLEKGIDSNSTSVCKDITDLIEIDPLCKKKFKAQGGVRGGALRFFHILGHDSQRSPNFKMSNIFAIRATIQKL